MEGYRPSGVIIDETPAKAALLRRLQRILGREHLDMVHLDIVNALLGQDCWSLLTDALLEAQIDRTP